MAHMHLRPFPLWWRTDSRLQQTHQKRSLPHPPRSRNPSPRHISMTARHTCWWIPHSQISPGGTSVCLWAEIKEIGRLLQWFYGPHKDGNKNIYETLLDSISIAPTMQLKLGKISTTLAN